MVRHDESCGEACDVVAVLVCQEVHGVKHIVNLSSYGILKVAGCVVALVGVVGHYQAGRERERALGGVDDVQHNLAVCRDGLRGGETDAVAHERIVVVVKRRDGACVHDRERCLGVDDFAVHCLVHLNRDVGLLWFRLGINDDVGTVECVGCTIHKRHALVETADVGCLKAKALGDALVGLLVVGGGIEVCVVEVAEIAAVVVADGYVVHLVAASEDFSRRAARVDAAQNDAVCRVLGGGAFSYRGTQFGSIVAAVLIRDCKRGVGLRELLREGRQWGAVGIVFELVVPDSLVASDDTFVRDVHTLGRESVVAGVKAAIAHAEEHESLGAAVVCRGAAGFRLCRNALVRSKESAERGGLPYGHALRVVDDCFLCVCSKEKQAEKG